MIPAAETSEGARRRLKIPLPWCGGAHVDVEVGRPEKQPSHHDDEDDGRRGEEDPGSSDGDAS